MILVLRRTDLHIFQFPQIAQADHRTAKSDPLGIWKLLKGLASGFHKFAFESPPITITQALRRAVAATKSSTLSQNQF